MSVLLLTTKLSIPLVRQGLLPRTHLLARVNEGLVRSLFLVSAPAGSGKTTLISTWARTAGVPVAWLSLDEADNDQCRFLTYVTVALKGISPELEQLVLPLLQTPQHTPLTDVLTVLMNRLSEVQEPFALVLDDYHLIETAAVHHTLWFLLEHLPPQMHLILITRTDPPLPLARLRGRGQLAELRAVDLRFSLDESAALLTQMMGLTLTASDVRALVGRTEGWAAGLQLAALSMQGRADLPGFIARFTGSQEYIADYLTDEVLEQQLEKTRTFLLQTSVLEQMTGSLCDAVLNCTDSQSVLEELHKSNLFLVSLDNERHWYRYHHLFAELLIHRLKSETPNLISKLHQRASEWFEHQGLLPEAIKHALDAQDFEHAARLINSVFDQLWGVGEHTTLKRWLERLPDETLHAWPQLVVRQAMFYVLLGQISQAKTYLHDAEQSLQEKKPVDINKWQGIIASLRGHFAWMEGDIPGTEHHSQSALAVLPVDEYEWRSFAAMTLGAASSLKGENADAGAAYEQALEIARESGNLRFILAPAIRLAYNLKGRGQLTQAMDLCEQHIQLIDESGHIHYSYQGALNSLLGDIQREWNRLDVALELAWKGLHLGKQGLEVETLTWNYFLLMRVLISCQDFHGAADILQSFERIHREHDVPEGVISRITEAKIQLFLAQHDLLSTERTLRQLESWKTASLTSSRIGEFIQWARFLLIQGQEQNDISQLNESLSLLARLEQVAVNSQMRDRLIKGLALKSLAYQAMEDIDKAADTLREALILGEPEQYIRTFVDEGAGMQMLLNRRAIPEISNGYLSKLRSAFYVGYDAPITGEALLQEPLSEREQQVLRYLKTHLTTVEIASELCISVHTIRSHVKSIYSKLHVQSRTEAVERARDLGID